MAELTVSHLNDRLVAIKQSLDDPDAIRHEARVLARLEHPGVVGFLEFDDRDPPALWMRHAGTECWEHDAPQDPHGVIAGLASVASTVRDLHDLGIAHGNLQPAHVIISRDGRPMLCSFAVATELTPASAAADGEGLARLIRHLSHDLEGDLRRRLDGIAVDVDDGSLDPAELTQRLDALGHRNRDQRVRGPRPRTAAALIAAVVAVVGVVVVASGSADQPAEALPPTTTPLPSTTTAPPEFPPPTTLSPASPPVVESTVPTQPPIELVHDGRRVGLGQTGDIVVLGDWDCSDIETPALLEMASGQVSIFTTWPEVSSTVAATSTVTIADATGLTVEPGEPCDRLRVTHPAGSTLVPLEPS